MNFLKNNKGVLVFYLLILVTTLVLVNNNDLNNLKDTSLVYVENN